MKKPVVDYKKLRPNNITSPEYRHLLYLLGWVGYFILYFLTENLIPVENCHVVHSPLDDIIPFCEVFIIPYVGWYLLIVVSLLYFALYNPESFKRLQTYIMITQFVAMAIYIIYPSVQLLRPEVMPRENIFTAIISFLYAFDTNTGVCPSLHVAYSLGILSVWSKEKGVHFGVKAAITVFVILICMSVAFVKQHSVVDIYAAIPLCLLAEGITYRKKYFKKKTEERK